jgi:diguanylate cyclase (GGDEF)-like protein
METAALGNPETARPGLVTMSKAPLSLSHQPGFQALSPSVLMQSPGQLSTATFLDGLRGALVVLAGLALVVGIALVDFATGPYLNISVFYLLPVAACAWWGGFSPGILLALAGAVAWQLVDFAESPAIPAIYIIWNGVVRFGTLVLTSSLVTRLHLGVRRERLLARTDALTGAANGRTFYEVAALEAERALRTSQPLTVAYLDLDNFKQLNDRRGHAAGDAALTFLVSAILPQLRGTDLLARLGGDEFALLLPGVEPEAAAALLGRLHGLVAEEMARKVWPLTLSIGAITFLRPLADVDLMIQRVDALMYRAKQKGKNLLQHAVLQHPRDGHDADGHWIEKRSTARAICNRAARLRLEGEGAGEGAFATVRDISTGNLGLDLEKEFARDTLLVVEPLCPEAKTLLARVLHATRGGRGWLHECELPVRLNAEDLRGWLGEAAC